MSAPYPQLKLNPWLVTVRGIKKFISVLSTETPDPMLGVQVDFYDPSQPWGAGAIVQVLNTVVINGVTVIPGTYALRSGKAVPANQAGNMVPQFPYPAGEIYWICLSLGLKNLSVCQNGTKTMYINASDPMPPPASI